jgi:serine/threonine protein phosphatase PrpC
MTFSHGQWIGRRSEQQDTFGQIRGDGANSRRFFVVSDGMGGYKGGRLASKTVVETFERVMKANPIWTLDLLRHALEESHERIKKLAQKPGMEKMGATVTAVCACATDLFWLSVGDSPLLLVRDGSVQRLNADHSMAPIIDEMAMRGEIGLEDARNDARRGNLRSVISREPINHIDIGNLKDGPLASDLVIAASDGLLTLDEDQIVRLTARPKADRLLAAVRKAKRVDQDNVTVAIWRAD